MNRLTERVFCAFCKLEREVYTKKHITWTNVLISIVAAFLFSAILWQGLDGRVVFIAVVAIIIAEIFVYMRWRMALTCPHCAFDPILYKTNRERVVAQVKARLETIRASDQYMLKRNNPLRFLPIRQKTDDGIKIVAKSRDLDVDI